MGIFSGYDIETFMSDVETVLRSNLNTYIGLMNADKGSPDLSDIDDSAYYIQTLNDAVINYNEFVFIFEEGISTEGIGPENSETYTVIAAIVSNFGLDPEGHSYKKMFRYREILKRIIQDKWGSLSRRANIKITSLSPFGVSVLNQSSPQVGVGISLEVSFA